MLGLSPPTGGAPRDHQTAGAAHHSPEPIDLEPEPRRGFGSGGIPVATVTRPSEPEIGSVDLALEAVVAAGVASAPPPPMPPGEAEFEPTPFTLPIAEVPEPFRSEPHPVAHEGAALPRQPAMGERAPDAAVAGPVTAPAWGPEFTPQQSFAVETARIASSEPGAHPRGMAEPVPVPPRAFDDAPGQFGPNESQPFGMQLQQPAPAEAIARPFAVPAPPRVASRSQGSTSGFVLFLWAVLGILVLSGAVLALVLWREPDSNLARVLRDMNPWRTPAAKVDPKAARSEPTPAAPEPVPAPGAGSEQPAATAVPTVASTGPALSALAASVEPAPPQPTGAVEATEGEAAPAEDEPAPTAGAPAPVEAVPTPAEPASEIPATVNRGRMEYLTNLAVRRAQQCHLSGRAQGTATAFLVFGPDGRVSDVRLEGEPVASAPVAACVIAKLKAVVIKPYDGPPFTHTTRVTLR